MLRHDEEQSVKLLLSRALLMSNDVVTGHSHQRRCKRHEKKKASPAHQPRAPPYVSPR
ncbi:hypothetical protein BN132_2161 [Cronobacter turicensis 564]|nr:hypothetical protein BN132_2161 [Cronobacter turicensis 564]